MTSTLLTLEGVSKTFGPVVALEDVSFSIGRGEVVGLVGENGAGKSTLMKILGGVITPSSGRVLIEGREIHFANARHSMNEGIAFVHQELNSFPNLSVAANILIGREPRKGPLNLFVDEDKAEALVQPLLQKLRADFTPSTAVADLSIAQRQLVEIAHALSFDARLVIMDEPTSSLTLSESNRLLEIVGELKVAGVSVIFITHRLNEIVEIADRVVVLRDGKLAGTLQKSEISPQAMIAHMIGRTLQTLYLPPAITSSQDGLTLTRVRTASFPQEEITLSVRRGEILGLAGLIGAGRSELAKAIFGIEPLLAGEIRINGAPVEVTSPGEAIAAGVALIPEDRKQSALLLAESIAENIGLNNWPQFSRGGLVDAVQSFHCLFKILSGPINGQYRRCLWRSKRLHRQAQRGSERKQVCKRLHIHFRVSQEQDGLSFRNQVRNQESTLTKLPFGRFGPSVGVVHGDLLPFIFRRSHLSFFHQSSDGLVARFAAVLR